MPLNIPVTHSATTQKRTDDGTVPWEHIDSNGIWKALIRTIRSCLLKPSQGFEQVAQSHDRFAALLFALICGGFGAIMTAIWNWVATTYIPWDTLPFGDSWITQSTSGTALLYSPLIIVLSVFLTAFYLHTILSISRSKHAPFASTLILVCYAESAVILNCIPFMGQFLASIWFIYILIVGIKKVHHISGSRAFFVLVVPIIILAIIAAIIGVMLVAVGGVLFGDIFKELSHYIR